MKRTLFALLLVAGTFIAFLLLKGRPAVAKAIEAEVERGPGHVFTLAEHTDFAWDRVFFFGPYTQQEWVEEALGHPWPGLFLSSISSYEHSVLVVFQHDGRIVEHFDLRRSQADLMGCMNSGRNGITPAVARFVVFDDGMVTLDEMPLDAPPLDKAVDGDETR